METIPIINQEIFNQNLRLTQAYCELQLANRDKHASEILRSINPEYDGKPMFHFLDGPYTYLEYNTDPLDSGLYDRFFDLQLEYKRNLLKGIQRTTTAKGQILMVDIYEALPDGASEAETEGFIDGNDCPPIDTWFYIGQGKNCPILFAWIPEPFVAIVDHGIAVNALEIFDWMENPKGVLNTGRFTINPFPGLIAPREMPGIDQEIFNQNLLLTQAYCEMQLVNTEKSPAEILRSFNPEYKGKPLYSFVQGQYSPPFYLSAQSSIYPFGNGEEHFYTDLFERQLLYKKKSVEISDSTKNCQGLILIANIDYSIPDGVSEIESQGFIDKNDCPPVDTWFYMEQGESTRILYSWIPAQFIELVNQGIDVNALDIFNWKDNPRHIDFSKEPKAENSRLEYQYHPHEKYKPERRCIFPIVCVTLLFIVLLFWFMFYDSEPGR